MSELGHYQEAATAAAAAAEVPGTAMDTEESGQEGTSTAEWDVFICHASEDKEDFVRPLAEGLRARGLRVWFDEFTLTVGDSLRRSIDLGLSKSRFGVVVISPNFLRKEWPQRELDGLVAREVAGVKVILPVWHRITADEVRAYSPTLADRVAASSDKGLEEVIAELMQAIRRDEAPNRTDTGSVTSSSPTSNVRVILRGPARRARFIIENLGPGIVQDVHFEVDEQEGKKSPLVANDCQEKLPVQILRPGARMELLAALTFGTGTTFMGKWWWREEDGRVEERIEKIALQVVQVVNETVAAKESGAVVGPARVIDPAAWIGCALLFVAFVVDFGIADYFGLPIPIAVGDWAWGFGMLFVAPKLLIWANRLKRRVVPISMHVMAKGVPTVKKRVIRAGDEKKPKG